MGKDGSGETRKEATVPVQAGEGPVRRLLRSQGRGDGRSDRIGGKKAGESSSILDGF